MRTMHLRLNPCLVAIVVLHAHVSSGCARQHFSSAYAAIPVQLVMTEYGPYEVLDRPDLARLAIAPQAERPRWAEFTAHVRDVLPFEGTYASNSSSPGSMLFEPLMQYFAQTGRSCRLIRGRPLSYGQWEFAYTCLPGFDTSVITWKPAGYSNAPIPPRR